MADITDVIARLSYQVVGDADLKAVVQNLKAQSQAIDQLKLKQTELKQAISSTTDAAKKGDLQSQYAKVNLAITQQTKALTNNVTTNQKLMSTLNQESGVIDTLNTKLKVLIANRNAATNPADIAKYAAQIKSTQAELGKLTSAGGSSVFGNLFGGGGSIGRQLLTGTLYGLGVGSGFGLITRAVSGLIDVLGQTGPGYDFSNMVTKLGDSMFDTTKYADGLKEAIKKTIDEIAKMSEEYVKATTNLPGTPDNLTQLQIQAANIKAQGVPGGNIAEANENQNNAQVAILNKQKEIAEANAKNLEYVKQALNLKQDVDIADFNLGKAQQNVSDKGGIGSSNEAYKQAVAEATQRQQNLELAQKNLEDFNTSTKDKYTGLSTASLTEELKKQEKLVDEIAKKESIGVTEAIEKITKDPVNGLNTLLAQAKDDVDKATAAAQQEQDEFNNKKYQDTQKTLKELRNKNTAEGIKGEQEQNNVKLDYLQKNLTQTESIINEENSIRKKNLDLQLTDQLNAYEIQIQAEKDNGRYTAEVYEQYEALKDKARQENSQKQKQADNDQLEQLRKFHEQQIIEDQKFDKQRRDLNVQSANQNLSNTPISEYAKQISRRQGVVNLDFDNQKQTAIDTYDNQLRPLEKLQTEFKKRNELESDAAQENAAEIETITQEKKQTVNTIEQNRFKALLSTYEDFYKTLLPWLKEQEEGVTNIIETQSQLQLNAIRKKLLGFGFDKDVLTYQQVVVTQDSDIQNYTNQRNIAQQQQGTAQSAVNDLKAQKTTLPDSATPEQIQQINDALQVAEDNLQAAKKQVAALESEITGAQIVIKNARVTLIQSEIDKYSELITAAKNAYDQVLVIQQQALDREISIREERIQQANILAARGNTAALQQEQDALNKEEQQREANAKRQIEINAALSASTAILAVVKAAAEGDPYTIAIRVLAAVASIVAGVASIKAETTSSANVGFIVGGHTGNGRDNEVAGVVHRNEFVMNAATTRKYRPLFEALHRGEPLERIPQTIPMKSINVHSQFASNEALKQLGEKVDNVAEAIASIRIEQTMNEKGLHQRMSYISAKEKRRLKT